MDPLERLTNLLALLLESRVPLTQEQLTNELHEFYPAAEAARRTAFERDKALLRSEGVPVRQTVLGGADAGRTAYWVDREDYELGDLGLDEEERRALQLATATVHLGTSWAEEGFWKLEQPGDPDRQTAMPLAATLPAVTALPDLHRAVTERAQVRFSYRTKHRHLEPYGLLARDGFWYVVGNDLDADEQRTYRLDRIEGAVRVGEPGTFERPPGFRAAQAFPADPKFLGDGELSGATEAQVWFGAACARAVTNELGVDSVLERRPDHSVVATVPCSNLPAFRSFVLGFLDDAEVLSPPEVRTEMIRWLRAVADAGDVR